MQWRVIVKYNCTGYIFFPNFFNSYFSWSLCHFKSCLHDKYQGRKQWQLFTYIAQIAVQMPSWKKWKKIECSPLPDRATEACQIRDFSTHVWNYWHPQASIFDSGSLPRFRVLCNHTVCQYHIPKLLKPKVRSVLKFCGQIEVVWGSWSIWVQWNKSRFMVNLFVSFFIH